MVYLVYCNNSHCYGKKTQMLIFHTTAIQKNLTSTQHECHPEPNLFAAQPEFRHIENLARHLSHSQEQSKMANNQV